MIQTGSECSNVACSGTGELLPTCAVAPTVLDFATTEPG